MMWGEVMAYENTAGLSVRGAGRRDRLGEPLLLGKLPVKAAGFPVITLGINVVGAFCIGLIVAAVGKHSGWDPRLVLFLKVGFCGGFTTFSTFSLETA